MIFRVGLFGFGHTVRAVFLGSKETRLKKVIRHGSKLKNHWVPEFLEIELDELEPLLKGREETEEISGKLESEQERNDDVEQNP